MRIAFVIDRFHPGRGGLEAWLAAVAAHLAARGDEAHLVSRDPQIADLPFVHHPLPAGGLTRARRDRRFAESAREFVRSNPFDVVVGLRHCLACDVYMPHGGAVAVSFEAHRRAKTLPAVTSGKVRNFLALEHELLEGPAPPRRVVAVSGLVRRDLERWYPGIADRILVIPNGVDLEHFNPEGREAARESIVPEGGKTVLFLAGNPRLKGWSHAGEVFARLRAEGCADVLLAAGGRPKGLPAGARWLGSVPDPVDLLRAADLLLHPTHYDPFPLVTLEALACGTPVATTEQNGAVEHTGRDGPVRAVSDPENHDGLATIARDLLREAPREEARCVAGRFPLDRSLDAFVQVLEDLAADGNRGPGTV